MTSENVFIKWRPKTFSRPSLSKTLVTYLIILQKITEVTNSILCSAFTSLAFLRLFLHFQLSSFYWWDPRNIFWRRVPSLVVVVLSTRPLPWMKGEWMDDGWMDINPCVEELHGDLTVGARPKVWTRGQKWKK